MNARRPILLPSLLALAAIAALAFAIVATVGDSSSGPAGRTTDSSPAVVTPGQGGFDGAELPGSIAAPDFTLTDQYGRPVSLSSYAGRVRVVAFVYSTCAAACVLLAQQIRGALDELPGPVPVLLVSAEPAADTPRSVRRFLARVSLSGRVHYLAAPRAALAAARRAYRIPSPAGPKGAQAFQSAASVLLVDRSGHERVLFGLEQLTPEALAHDIGKLEAG